MYQLSGSQAWILTKLIFIISPNEKKKKFAKLYYDVIYIFPYEVHVYVYCERKNNLLKNVSVGQIRLDDYWLEIAGSCP